MQRRDGSGDVDDRSHPAIRAANLGDVAAMREIYRECVENGTASYELEAPSVAEFQRRFNAITARGYPFMVATHPDSRIAGYAYVSAFRERPAYNWVVEDSIYLEPAARRSGIGRMLLGALLERSQALGFRQMVAVIGGADQASIGLHLKCGFDMVGHMPATGYKFGRWLDTAIMQKALGIGDGKAADPAAYPGTLRP